MKPQTWMDTHVSIQQSGLANQNNICPLQSPTRLHKEMMFGSAEIVRHSNIFTLETVMSLHKVYRLFDNFH